MNLLFLPDKYHIGILDGGADTCVLGKGYLFTTQEEEM